VHITSSPQGTQLLLIKTTGENFARFDSAKLIERIFGARRASDHCCPGSENQGTQEHRNQAFWSRLVSGRHARNNLTDQGDRPMKHALIAGAAAVVIMSSSQAFAQAVVVEISPEQRTTIRQYVVKQRVKPATIRGEIAVGSTLPADVELVTVPSDWGPGLNRYRYVYWNDRVVLVEPGNRRIVYVID
jgi:hypothetical protein